MGTKMAARITDGAMEHHDDWRDGTIIMIGGMEHNAQRDRSHGGTVRGHGIHRASIEHPSSPRQSTQGRLLGASKPDMHNMYMP